MKVSVIIAFLTTLTSFYSNSKESELISVLLVGSDDGIKTNVQEDYNQALMNAKQQAVERAGLFIESNTTVENFSVTFSKIESNASAVLLPGFQVVNIGYTEDGTYQVVLSGSVKSIPEDSLWRLLLAQETYENYENYLRVVPDTFERHAKVSDSYGQYRDKDDLHFREALATSTLTAYDFYLTTWPDGRYRQILIEKREFRVTQMEKEWSEVKKDGSIESIDLFLQHWEDLPLEIVNAALKRRQVLYDEFKDKKKRIGPGF